jgi:hypothetical protein
VYDALPSRPPVLVVETDSEALQEAQALINASFETVRAQVGASS